MGFLSSYLLLQTKKTNEVSNMDKSKEYKKEIDNFSLEDKQGSKFPSDFNENLKKHQLLKQLMLQKQSMEQKQEPDNLADINSIEDVKKHFQTKNN